MAIYNPKLVRRKHPGCRYDSIQFIIVTVTILFLTIKSTSVATAALANYQQGITAETGVDKPGGNSAVDNAIADFDVETRNRQLGGRMLLAAHDTSTDSPMNETDHSTHSDSSHSSGDHMVFPASIFTEQQLMNGALILYIIGVVYMFVCMAIVCEEFFVPSVQVISELLNLSEDVAGATFLAFAGSGPEIFTSFIGVFLARTSIGIGTIVGSAVFNLTIVHGVCALVCPTGFIQLAWWAVFRDFFFYSISLIMLIIFFADDLILWWESLLLIICYCFYVLFMKYNAKIQSVFKRKFGNTIDVGTAHDSTKGNGGEKETAKQTHTVCLILLRSYCSLVMHTSSHAYWLYA